MRPRIRRVTWAANIGSVQDRMKELDMGKLDGRSAIITGGSRGAGAGIARVFAGHGADVAIIYRKDEASANETVAAIEAQGRRGYALAADIADYEQAKQAIDGAVAALGKVDILVNNAGIASRGRFVADTEIAELHRVLGVHFFGSYYCSQLVIPAMREQRRGDILFVTSSATKTHGAGGVPYGAAKAAMEALAKALAKEERRNGIRVNVMAPSLIESEMGRRLVRATRGVEDITTLHDESPFGKVLQPEELGDLAAFLCAEENFRVSGQVIYMDGGM